MAERRRFLTCLTALAVVAVVPQGLTGIDQLALTLTPLFPLTTLLPSGRYLGEKRIVARWRGSARRRGESPAWSILGPIRPKPTKSPARLEAWGDIGRFTPHTP